VFLLHGFTRRRPSLGPEDENHQEGSYRFVNTDPAIAAVQLITISCGGSKTIEVTLTPLLIAIERL